MRKTNEILDLSQKQEKLFSELNAVINGIEVRNYEGCSACKRKLNVGEHCNCNPDSILKEFTIMKLMLGDSEGWIEGAVFDE